MFVPKAGGPQSRLLRVALPVLVTNTVHCSMCYWWCFAASYWGIAILQVAFCRKLLRNCKWQGDGLLQAIVELYNLQGGVLPQAIGELQLQDSADEGHKQLIISSNSHVFNDWKP